MLQQMSPTVNRVNYFPGCALPGFRTEDTGCSSMPAVYGSPYTCDSPLRLVPLLSENTLTYYLYHSPM